MRFSSLRNAGRLWRRLRRIASTALVLATTCGTALADDPASRGFRLEGNDFYRCRGVGCLAGSTLEKKVFGGVAEGRALVDVLRNRQDADRRSSWRGGKLVAVATRAGPATRCGRDGFLAEHQEGLGYPTADWKVVFVVRDGGYLYQYTSTSPDLTAARALLCPLMTAR